MRIAIISDVHGNLEALEQVLSDTDCSDIDEILCLGDNVGYGPEPEGTLSTFPSTTAMGSFAAMELTAAAVYGPTPGSFNEPK